MLLRLVDRFFFISDITQQVSQIGVNLQKRGVWTSSNRSSWIGQDHLLQWHVSVSVHLSNGQVSSSFSFWIKERSLLTCVPVNLFVLIVSLSLAFVKFKKLQTSVKN